jgi:hypothetical protein
MHRMQIAGARIGPLMQLQNQNLLWRNEAFDSSHGGKDMQTLYANETNNAKKYPSKLTEKTMNLIFQLSTRIEVNLYCEMPTMWNSNWGL